MLYWLMAKHLSRYFTSFLYYFTPIHNGNSDIISNGAQVSN